MRINNFFKLVIAIVVSELAGVIGSVFTTPAIADPSAGSGLSWYASIIKPDFNPPAWVFGPVWTTLFVLMGVAAFLIWREYSKDDKKRGRQIKIALGIFIGQLILNTLWSIIFFGSTTLTINGLNNIGIAFIEIIFLWLTILATIIAFAKISRVAMWLLIPYILWVSFAGFLNYSIWQLNKDLPTNTTTTSSSFQNDKIEKAITDYLLTQKQFSWKTVDDSKNVCVIENLAPEQELFPLYVWAYCAEYSIKDGEIKTLSGVSTPAKIDYPNELSFYDINRFSYESPRDGAQYSEDIKRIFPENIWQTIFNFDRENIIKKFNAVVT